MPNNVPATRPGTSEPSRSKNFTPRSQPANSMTGSAPTERISACITGGTSGSASFTAIWLKPQLRHSISTKAMAPGVSARPDEGDISLVGIVPHGTAWMPCCYYFWQCAQVPAISTTESFGANPDARAAALRLCATGAAGISPTEPQ